MRALRFLRVPSRALGKLGHGFLLHTWTRTWGLSQKSNPGKTSPVNSPERERPSRGGFWTAFPRSQSCPPSGNKIALELRHRFLCRQNTNPNPRLMLTHIWAMLIYFRFHTQYNDQSWSFPFATQREDQTHLLHDFTYDFGLNASKTAGQKLGQRETRGNHTT